MTRGNTITKSDIRYVSRTTARVLGQYGIDCALFGSAACMFHGTLRRPNDVDVIVLSGDYEDTEDIKHILTNEDDRFYTVPSANPRNSYQVLWFELVRGGRSCKVDILLPGIMEIPNIPLDRIEYFGDYDVPVVPLDVLILLKLKGWYDHHYSRRRDFQEKQYYDVEDIRELLEFATDQGIFIYRRSWLPRRFLRGAYQHYRDFIDEYPEFYDGWDSFGIGNCQV